MPELLYRRLIRASALYDILATAAFATPWSFALLHGMLSQLTPLPPFAPTHLLLANLLGSIVLVWSLLRLRDPQARFGLYDAAARGLFLLWQLYYLLALDGAWFVWIFAAFEAGFGLAQAYGYWLLQQVQRQRAGAPLRCALARRLAAA